MSTSGLPAPQEQHQQSGPRTGFWAEVGRDLRNALLEMLAWAVAIVVLVGGPASIGYAVGGTVGALVGGVLGAVALGLLWLSLVIAGVTLAVRMLFRRRTPDA